MAKNNKKSSSSAKKIVSAAKRVVTKTVTEVRNTPIPKIAKKSAATVAPRVITHDDIAKRAYEIYASGTGGSETDNWYRAERELRGL